MQIDQWVLVKAMVGGFASVFFNYRIMLPFFIALLLVFFMKRVVKRLEARIKNSNFRRRGFRSRQ
jgi:predicted PurR-regulated permease PerM